MKCVMASNEAGRDAGARTVVDVARRERCERLRERRIVFFFRVNRRSRETDVPVAREPSADAVGGEDDRLPSSAARRAAIGRRLYRSDLDFRPAEMLASTRSRRDRRVLIVGSET